MFKYKFTINVFTVFVIASVVGLNPKSAKARGGQSVGNGGQVVDDGGRPELRDFVAAERCTWMSGSDFAGSLVHYPRMMQTIEDRNWLLAYGLKNEVSRLRVCLSADKLRSVENQEGSSLVDFSPGQNVAQVAIREQNTVYIDQAIFNKLDDTSRAYLLLHETLHTFVMYRSQLNDRIVAMRSFTNFVRSIDEGTQSANASLFQSLIEQYAVYLPWETDYSNLGCTPGMNNSAGECRLWIPQVIDITAKAQTELVARAFIIHRLDLVNLLLNKGFPAPEGSDADRFYCSYPGPNVLDLCRFHADELKLSRLSLALSYVTYQNYDDLPATLDTLKSHGVKPDPDAFFACQSAECVQTLIRYGYDPRQAPAIAFSRVYRDSWHIDVEGVRVGLEHGGPIVLDDGRPLVCALIYDYFHDFSSMNKDNFINLVTLVTQSPSYDASALCEDKTSAKYLEYYISLHKKEYGHKLEFGNLVALLKGIRQRR